MTRRVLLAGEGKSELGGWGVEPSYRAPTPLPGVLEALLRHISPDGFRIVDAVQWKKLPYYRTRDRLPKDELNTQALWSLARERNCDLVVFSRDRDGFVDRQTAVNRGISWLDERAANAKLSIVGGVAIECIEAWVLAVMGERKTESLGRIRPKEIVTEQGLAGALASTVEGANLGAVPDDAGSLKSWLARAARAFGDPP